MRLRRGLQKAASQESFTYRLKLLVEGDAEPLQRLMMRPSHVAGPGARRSDHVSQGSVQARIRQSIHPLLVVCAQQCNSSDQ